MSTEVKLQVDDEIKAFGDSLKALITDVVAKKPTAVIIADVLPGFLSAAGNYAAMGADIKKVDNQTYLARCLAEAIEGPAPQVSPQPV